jgi:hypothetical protein
MGILVSGATRVEEELEDLKRNLMGLTEGNANPRVNRTMKRAKRSLHRARIGLSVMIERSRPVGKRIENETRQFLHRTNIHSRILLVTEIDRTIAELERFRQKLDRVPLDNLRSA